MIELFERISHVESGRIQMHNIDYFKRSYQRELYQLQEYYHNSVRFVNSEHLLCRLLNLGALPFYYEIYRYAQLADARAGGLSRHFRFTSELSSGEIRDSVFYGSGHKEVIISHEDYFDPVEVYTNWKTVEAVRVIRHPFSDLAMLLPNGKSPSAGEGLIYITINIPMLLVQYKGFLQEQYEWGLETGEGALTVANFVAMYVLPNMVGSHLDNALLNRAMNLYYGEPMGVPRYKHPFYVSDYSSQVDRALEDLLLKLMDKRKLYEWYLKNLPAFIQKDQEVAQQIPDLTPMRQVWWAVLLSRVDIVKFLLDLGSTEGERANGANLNKYRKELVRVKRDHSLQTRLGRDLYNDIIGVVDEVLEV